MNPVSGVRTIHTTLLHVLELGAKRAKQSRTPVLVSSAAPIEDIDPLAFFHRGRSVALDRFFWATPKRDVTIVGIGAATHIEAKGTDRFSTVQDVWTQLSSEAIVDWPEKTPDGYSTCMIGPLLLGGFSFQPRCEKGHLWQGYPDSLLILPEIMLTHAGDSFWLSHNAILKPDSDPIAYAESFDAKRRQLLEDRFWPCGADLAEQLHTAPCPLEVEEVGLPAWKASVGLLAQKIREGDLDKAVLAREVRIRSRDGRVFSPTRALSVLHQAYPACYVFAVARGERCFLGATPERLVALQNDEVRAMGLAGSTGRGLTEAEDDRLGGALLTNAKNRTEHAIVVQSLRAALDPVCDPIQIDAEPTLLKAANVQHLHTPITGRLHVPRTLLQLVDSVHPTPAVGGYPKDRALAILRAHENIDRGWYAGPVGWTDRRGQGEFAVGIRSALLFKGTASLFAGCGIVADSAPESEYVESCLKLRPMLDALERSVE